MGILETDFDKRVEADMAEKTPIGLIDCWKMGFVDSGTISAYAEYRVKVMEYYNGDWNPCYICVAAFYPAQRPDLIKILGGRKYSVFYYYPNGMGNEPCITIEDPSYEQVALIVEEIKHKYNK
jgi:hypothetical protein